MTPVKTASSYISAKDKAKLIRKELKNKGITSKQVSVRTDNSCLDSSITCTIKDLSVPKELVEKIARRQEHLYRDHYSGEILSGGNTFIFVNFDWEILDKAKEEFRCLAEAIKPGLIAETKTHEVIFIDGHWGKISCRNKKTGEATSYIAHNKHAIAEALTLLKYQHGIAVKEGAA